VEATFFNSSIPLSITQQQEQQQHVAEMSPFPS